MYFTDITNYNKTGDYLPILNALLFVDIIIMLLVFRRTITPYIIYKWYLKYKLYAVMVDITTIFIVIITTRYIYSLWTKTNNSYGSNYSLGVFLAIAIFSQICFDIFMYLIIQSVPNGSNQMIDIFRKYTKEGSVFIFTLDCSFTLFALFFASLFNSFTLNTNLVILISFLNILSFLVFTN